MQLIFWLEQIVGTLYDANLIRVFIFPNYCLSPVLYNSLFLKLILTVFGERGLWNFTMIEVIDNLYPIGYNIL